MCVKWQHFAAQKRTVGLSMIVNMSATNIKTSKSKKEFSSIIGTKKKVTIKKLVIIFLVSWAYMRAPYERLMGHSNGIKSEGQRTTFH